MTAVLGLDLSLRGTGWCGPGEGIGTYVPPSPTPLGDLRLWEIRNHVLSLVSGPSGGPLVDLVAMEGPFLNVSTSTLPLVGLNYVTRVALISNRIRYLIVAPSTLKMYATGAGNAKKPELRMELYKRTGLDLADDNQVDAWWLHAIGKDLAGEPVIELPQTHRRALKKLVLPKGFS